MKFIKQSSIDTVLEEATIYEVVSASEDLKKKGAYWFCKSPFTSEKSASFCVNPVKNTFFDYSAGFGGNAVSFLRKRFSITFFEAIERAAALCNILLEFEEMSEDAKRLHDEEQAMKSLLEQTAEKYQQQFTKLTLDHWAKDMIVNGRAYSEEAVHAFMIGYAPDERSFVSTPAINAGRFEISKDLGLTNTKDGASYDFFRDRIMFPIHNHQGFIIGFTGRRSNAQEQEKYAKYLNSKESKVFLKNKVLYGYFQAKRRIAETGKAVLLEGPTDVISLHQAGLTNSVCPLGTAFGENQAKLLKRVCNAVILFLDGDKAGLRAALRNIDILLKEGFTVSVVTCPSGEDPDSLSRQCNITEFVERHAEDAILWKAKLLKEDAKNPDIISLSKTLKAAHDAEVEQLREKMVTDEAMKGMDATDRKFVKKENEQIFKKIQLLEREMKAELEELPKYEPQALSRAVEEMGHSLFLIPNKVMRDTYVKTVARLLEQKIVTITQIITSREEEEETNRQARKEASEEKEINLLGLPKGGNPDQYLKDRFCEVDNSYHFHDGKSFFKGTNFRMIPLFHVEGKMDNKRLCEVVNEYNHKRLIDFDSTDLINFTKIQERLIMEGFFFWEPGTTTSHFKLVAKKLLNDFITATELKVLGLQKQGFFAFADGVVHNNEFHKVNKYGIVHVDGLEAENNEYRSDITHFYSPSHSEIYKAANEGDDPYENDRHFIYKIAPISLEVWMKQMSTVFGDKGKFGIMFCIAANFRDMFLANWKYFPLLGGFGQRDSGKSGFGMCVQSFFYYNLPALELTTSTLVGISRRLTRCKNVVNFFDEYRDDLDEDKNQQLKGAWNGIGREKGKGFDSNRTSTDKINSALYYAGQYLPARDDGALASRTIILNFEQKEHTAEEKEEYGKLMSWNKAGISSFVLNVLQHRKYVQENLIKSYNEVAKELKLALKDTEYQNRVYENYLVPLVILKLLEERFAFPFTYKQYFELTKEAIIDNSETISDTDGLAAFWRIVEYLANPEARTIREGHDYMIEKSTKVTIIGKKKEKTEIHNSERDEILYLDFSKIHQDYHKEVSKRQGEEVISGTVIRNYLRSKKYFIGLFPSKRMGHRTPSGYAFNYSMMKRLGILNLPHEGNNQTELDELLTSTKKKIITNPNQVTAL